MKLLVGLGNPGKKYEQDRHNIGFMVLDAVASYYNAPAFSAKFQGLLSEATIAGEKLYLLKPTTYMNLSGHAVREAMTFYKISLEDVMVVHDELDIATARIKVKRGGGHAGHNGLKHIDQMVGKDYIRIRFGIDHPGDRDQVSSYVLHPFAKSDQALVEAAIDQITRELPVLIEQGMEAFISKIGVTNGV